MKVVLAEKPSVARELAAFLGAGSRRDVYFEGKGYQVTWALGHLITLKEPHDYDPSLKKWSLATLPFIRAV
jgi:DNA topoisomerase-3